jgi:hypothetical protein
VYTEISYHPTTHNGVFVVNLLIRPIHCQFSYPDNQELVKLLTGQPYVVSCFRYYQFECTFVFFAFYHYTTHQIGHHGC